MEKVPPEVPVTPEMLQQGRRLAHIMIPHAMRQSRRLFEQKPGQTHARFVHYTTAEAALSIIRTKRFWMRNTNCMSDYREVQHGFDLLNKFLSDAEKYNSFAGALDDCSPGIAAETIDAFNRARPDIRLNSYIACLSEHLDSEDLNGRLSMWRGFGGATTRIGIVLSLPQISFSIFSLGLTFSPVAYLTEPEVHAVLEEVVENVRNNRDYLRSIGRNALVQLIFITLLSAVVCLKHEGFHEEREWRAIYAPTRRPSRLVESSTEVVSGVPQVVYKVPLDASVSEQIADLDFTRIFDHLIIGPTPYPWPIYGAFVDELTRAGVANPSERVRVSDIPIRA